MANKTIKTRIQNKYDVEKNWDQASFTPLRGELIFYGPDKDDAGNVLHELPRFKVGDGSTPINELPIVDPTPNNITCTQNVTEDGVLYLDVFKAGIQMSTADNSKLMSSNSILITTEEEK